MGYNVGLIKRTMNEGDFFSALSFSGFFYRAGDIVALMLAIRKFGDKYGYNGMYFLAALHAAEEIEKRVGFFDLFFLDDVHGRTSAYKINKRLLLAGFFARAPFPDSITHITRVRKVYKLTDKGRESLRYFRTEYMRHQKLSKKARLKMMESLNTF